MTNDPLLPLYIVVVNWNLPNETIECITSILASNPADKHIILVDNGSQDRSVGILEEWFSNSIEIIENSTNVGFAAGANIGIRHALEMGAGSILLLNNDTTIEPSMIDHLLTTARDHPKAGLVGPVIYYADSPQRLWRIGDVDIHWLPIPVQVSHRQLIDANQSDFQLDYITACGMLICREVLETVGLLDERYFMYYEDADICQRASNAGFDIWCSPQAKMWHKVSLSSKDQKPIQRYLQSWGRIDFYHRYKHGLAWLLVLGYLFSRAIALTLNDLLNGKLELIRPLWWGFMDGLSRRSPRSEVFM